MSSPVQPNPGFALLATAYCGGIFLVFQRGIWACFRHAKRRPHIVDGMVFIALTGASLGLYRTSDALVPISLLLGALLPSTAITLYAPERWDYRLLVGYSACLVIALLALLLGRV